MDIPYDRTMLRCVSDYPKQRDSAGATRAENVRGRFRAIAGSHQRVVLVDDIITSGNTAAECSKVLLEAGCEEVRVVALAVFS